jgi:hypothetical protein
MVWLHQQSEFLKYDRAFSVFSFLFIERTLDVLMGKLGELRPIRFYTFHRKNSFAMSKSVFTFSACLNVFAPKKNCFFLCWNMWPDVLAGCDVTQSPHSREVTLHLRINIKRLSKNHPAYLENSDFNQAEKKPGF